MWNRKRSLILSKVFTLFFMVALLAVLVATPWLVDWFMVRSFRAYATQEPLFLLTIYIAGAIAAVLLASLYLLLHNVEKDKVFVQKNVGHLRRISWCCFIMGGVFAASALYYLPWGILGVGIAFVGLIVRIVKNILAQAMALKEENDYTI